MQKNKSDSYDRYGTLITVASLLFVVIYASEKYDGWDLIIAIIAAIFGIKYLREKAYFDIFSLFLGMLIASTGVLVTIASFIQIVSSLLTGSAGEIEPLKETDGGVSYVLIAIVFVTIVGTYINRKIIIDTDGQ